MISFKSCVFMEVKTFKNEQKTMFYEAISSLVLLSISKFLNLMHAHTFFQVLVRRWPKSLNSSRKHFVKSLGKQKPYYKVPSSSL